MTTSSSGSPDNGPGADLAIFIGIWTHSSCRALERVTVERLMLARGVAAAVVPRSTAESPGTFAWDGDLRHLENDIASVPHHLGADLASPSSSLATGLGSGIASVRRKLPRL
jgi:hypothetical protein